MAKKQTFKVFEILERNETEVLTDWMKEQLASVSVRTDLMNESELRQQSSEFLNVFKEVLRTDPVSDISLPEWSRVRELLWSISRFRAIQGFTPVETAMFIFSLKQPLFNRLQKELMDNSGELINEVWNLTLMLDKLGLFTSEAYLRSREEVIIRQQREMIELSTPVVQLWNGILALPLIGTLDSERTQVVMENLLTKIVETGSYVSIIDITGVPTVDTLVAQHLLKTVAAAKLMGAECIISGIRPQIAQTIVHLGVNLEEVMTKATMAEAFKTALLRNGLTVSKIAGNTSREK
ncbi:MAG: STAS domain-containing protein [Ignavibacteriales bacterium]